MVIHNKAKLEAVREKVAAGFSFADIAFVVGDTLDIVGGEHSSKIAARMKHFQRLGIPARRPGRGAKTPYALDEMIEITLSFQFVQAGMEPGSIVELLKGWSGTKIINRVLQEFEAAIAGHRGGLVEKKDTAYLWFEPHFSTFHWDQKEGPNFEINFGNQIDLQKCVASTGYGRLTIINIGFFSYYNFCAVLRLLELWEG